MQNVSRSVPSIDMDQYVKNSLFYSLRVFHCNCAIINDVTAKVMDFSLGRSPGVIMN